MKDALRDHITVYLVPPDPDGQREASPLEDYFAEIFEEELEGWSRDEAEWPQTRDLKTFLRWFDAEPAGLVFNLDGESVLEEEA